MTNLTDEVKKKIGFRDHAATCKDCKFIEIDPTFDEYSTGN
jgi:hypothetical protein